MLNTSCEFHFSDVTVTSVINIIDGDVAVESILQGTAFCYSFSVAKSPELARNAIHTEINPMYGDKFFYETNNTCLV